MLFINDLPEYLIAFKLILFADDTSVAVRAKSIDQLIRICEDLIRRFEAWCRGNSLIVNLNKTQIIKFQNRELGQSSPLVLRMSGGSLKTVECVPSS